MSRPVNHSRWASISTLAIPLLLGYSMLQQRMFAACNAPNSGPQVTLSFSWYPEEADNNTILVAVNDNDNDGTTGEDRNCTTPVPNNDSDLRPFYIKVAPTTAGGSMKLTFDSTKVRVWSAANKVGGSVASDSTWSINGGDIPLWLEGFAKCKTTLTLTYVDGIPSPGTPQECKIKATIRVVKVGIDTDSNGYPSPTELEQYLPGYHNTTPQITDTAQQDLGIYIEKADSLTGFKFILSATSDHEGYCVNSIKTDPYTDTDKDFVLKKANTVADTISGVEIDNNERADTVLRCRDYGGKTTLRVEWHNSSGGVWLVGELSVPMDKDGDGIADKWEKSVITEWNTQYSLTGSSAVGVDDLSFFSPAQDNEERDPDGSSVTTLLAHGAKGDRLSVLQEYRGLFGTYPDTWEKHRRLSPCRKELLVEVDAMKTSGPYTALTSTEIDEIFSLVRNGPPPVAPATPSKGFWNSAGVEVYYYRDEMSIEHKAIDNLGELVNIILNCQSDGAAGKRNCTNFVHLVLADRVTYNSELWGTVADEWEGGYVFVGANRDWAATQTEVTVLQTIASTVMHELGHAVQCQGQFVDDDYIMWDAMAVDAVKYMSFNQTMSKEIPSMNVAQNYSRAPIGRPPQ